MRRAVLFDALEYDSSDPEGYRSAATHLTKLLGARELAVKAFELPPGESLCPYHYEYVEEWLIVLEGSVVIRTPDGEEAASAGNAVCFPAGPDGAHKLTNRGGRAGAGCDVLQRARAVRLRLPGQRQDRHLARDRR